MQPVATPAACPAPAMARTALLPLLEAPSSKPARRARRRAPPRRRAPQERNSFTHFRGIIRRRLMPVVLSRPGAGRRALGATSPLPPAFRCAPRVIGPPLWVPALPTLPPRLAVPRPAVLRSPSPSSPPPPQAPPPHLQNLPISPKPLMPPTAPDRAGPRQRHPAVRQLSGHPSGLRGDPRAGAPKAWARPGRGCQRPRRRRRRAARLGA
jgi:hypothetical protein